MKIFLLVFICLFSFSLYAQMLKNYNGGYIVCFDDMNHIPIYTIYTINKQTVEKSTLSRKGISFKKDKSLLGTVSSDEYKNTRYNRFHFVPAEDLSYDSEFLHSTFFTSNIAPGNEVLNKGKWSQIELYARKKAVNENKQILIVTGCFYIYHPLRTIGKSHVLIPLAFYKILIYEDKYEVFVELND